MLAVFIELVCALLTLSGIAYLLIALLGIRSFGRQAAPVMHGLPPTVSILKPVKGSDPGLYESFASNCRQNYAGRYELLLGQSDATEPLDAMAAQLRAEFPNVPVRVLPCPERLGTNGKVSTLAQMVPHALGDVLVINDADIRVSPNYLTSIAASLSEPGVGMVTAPYLGQVVPRGGLWSKLEALGISVEFLPGICAARLMEHGIRFGLGSTLALRRETLADIGGIEVLLDYLADDYELGVRVHAAGHRVVLSREIVATTVPLYSFRTFAEHQLRWSRTVRDARPLQYIGFASTFALPWALATVLASGFALWSFSLLSLALLLRFAVALSGGVGVLRDGQVLRDLFLVPVRDCFSLLLWAWSYADNVVVWRGERFLVRKGKLQSAS